MGVIINPWAGAAMKGEGSGGEDDRTSPNIVETAPSATEGADVARPDGPEQDDAPSPYLPVDALWGDVVAPENDRLRNPLWWVLEFIPFMTGHQDEHDRWHNYLRCVSCMNRTSCFSDDRMLPLFQLVQRRTMQCESVPWPKDTSRPGTVESE
jgi:hypothetical protein